VPRGGIARRSWGPFQEFDLFVTQLVTEMTVKAGQKCAAIRRAFVPTAALDDVEEAVAAKLAEVTVGNPADPTVTMGALASLVQRDDVRGQVRKLAAAARLVHGDPDRVDLVDADAERGAFLAALLLRFDDARCPSRMRWRRSVR
jgi:oxepin-CoA hydrolase/3-oxo-5,6-dehydrosuberyl-CoA semialdehyde dehydrogenase